jgi:hypothetical protein
MTRYYIRRTAARVTRTDGDGFALPSLGARSMNADEMNWLLQTIQEPETAKRFVQAQYELGRIPYQLVVDLARQRGWTDYPPVRVWTAPSTSAEYATAHAVIFGAVGAIL